MKSILWNRKPSLAQRGEHPDQVLRGIGVGHVEHPDLLIPVPLAGHGSLDEPVGMRGREVGSRAHEERRGPQSRGAARVGDAPGHLVEVAEAGAPVEPVADVLLVPVIDLHDLDAQVLVIDHREVVEDVLRGDLVPVRVPGAPAGRQLLHGPRHQPGGEQVAHRGQPLVERRRVQVLDHAVRGDDEPAVLVPGPDRRDLDARGTPRTGSPPCRPRSRSRAGPRPGIPVAAQRFRGGRPWPARCPCAASASRPCRLRRRLPDSTTASRARRRSTRPRGRRRPSGR